MVHGLRGYEHSEDGCYAAGKEGWGFLGGITRSRQLGVHSVKVFEVVDSACQ